MAHGYLSMKAWLSLIKTFTYCTLTPSDLKHLALPPSPKCRARIVQQCLLLMYEFQFTLLFWSSTTAQQPTLKFIRHKTTMILFCPQILWVRYFDQAEQRCLACLCSTMPQGQAGKTWMGEVDSNSWAGIIWRLHSWVWKFESSISPTCELSITAV